MIVHWFTTSVHENYKLRTWGEHVVCKNCSECQNKNKKTIFVQNMFSPCSELVVFMYWTGKSMNNLLSYYGLVDVRINASDKDLPVTSFMDVPSQPHHRKSITSYHQSNLQQSVTRARWSRSLLSSARCLKRKIHQIRIQICSKNVYKNLW